ncbi:hypothetical protein K7432_014138, partial [Basidiobolus ranarum]
PDNGNSHNQLAVIHTYSDDKLSAIYHYFRSLATIEPFPTSKDNVALLFNKALKSHFKHGDVEHCATNESLFDKFIFLHGLSFMKSSHISTVFEPTKLSFIINFQESIQSRDLSPDQILKLIVINIIGVHLCVGNVFHDKRTLTGDYNKRASISENHLFFFNIEVFIALLSACNKSWKTEYLEISLLTRRILPSLRIGMRWLLNSLHTYAPLIPQFSDEEAEIIEEFFQQWDEFLYHVEESVTRNDWRLDRSVLLKEDIEMRGFEPLQADHDVLLQDPAKITPLTELQNRMCEFVERRKQFSKFRLSKYWGAFFKSYWPLSCARFLNSSYFLIACEFRTAN